MTRGEAKHSPFVLLIFHSQIQLGSATHRPEGPLANSHAREGVDIGRNKTKAPKVRQLFYPSIVCRSFGPGNQFNRLFHALTVVAIS